MFTFLMNMLGRRARWGVYCIVLLWGVAGFQSAGLLSKPGSGAGYIDSKNGRTAVNEKDSLALVAFYIRTVGDDWTNNTNWLTGPVDTWYGITVAENRVTRIELDSNNVWRDFDFDSSIPPEIGDLSGLKVLDLRFNNVGRTFPEEFANLIQLEQLLLSGNWMIELPDLDNFPSLMNVMVDDNLLTFEDIEPSIGKSFEFTYAPQKLIGSGASERAFKGETLRYPLPVGGQFNAYQWFRDGVAMEGQTSDTLTINNVSESNVSGTFHLEVTNTLVTDLTLTSREFTIWFDVRFQHQWLDIGAYHNLYLESGARHLIAPDLPKGMYYPAILRRSSHDYSQGFWIGVKDWTDSQGEHYPYFVATIGPDASGSTSSFPTSHELIGRYPDTSVEVNGVPSSDKESILDSIDPGIAADRMIHNVFNTSPGITVTRNIYAFTNSFHDNYHLIERQFCNTGNIDTDEEIELPDQTLHEVYFFRAHRWRGNEQGNWNANPGQNWGKFSMIDIVGDGNEQYPVDFTAIYLWPGEDPFYPRQENYSFTGSPIFRDNFAIDTSPTLMNWLAPGDTVGRLSGHTFVGRSVIHADNSPDDLTYDPDLQPHTIGWADSDSRIFSNSRESEKSRSTMQELYEHGILSPENAEVNPGCTRCSSRMYPHFADRVEPTGEFWAPQNDPSMGRAGGFTPLLAYGPYDLEPGDCVHVVESEGIAGLSFDAATKIGQAYKNAGSSRESVLIDFDANGDDLIDTTPFDYDNVFVGTEAQTKNQWVMTARDSLFRMFYRARDAYTMSNSMTSYPIAEPPHAPTTFSLWSRPEGIELQWTPALAGPEVASWELFRTENWVDNLYANGCLDDTSIACGYEHIVTLLPETTSYSDTDIVPGVAYFYYLQAVGKPQAHDPDAIAGTPGGQPLRSGRYLTQTYRPISVPAVTSVDANLPYRFSLEGNYPNPFTQQTRIAYVLPEAMDVELAIYDVLGRRVQVALRGFQSAGRHEHVFDAAQLATGVYIYVLHAGDHKAEGKMIRVR